MYDMTLKQRKIKALWELFLKAKSEKGLLKKRSKFIPHFINQFQIQSSGFRINLFLWLWVYQEYSLAMGIFWVYTGFTLGVPWVYFRYFRVYLRITLYVYSEYTILRVYLEYTMGILGVCYWYSLGNILGISRVYSRYTVDIPWLYYVLLPLCMYSVPAMQPCVFETCFPVSLSFWNLQQSVSFLVFRMFTFKLLNTELILI